MSGPARGYLSLPRLVRDAERVYREARRAAAGVPVDQPAVGLALSGGGIRSATFCLGALQRLARAGVLKHVDSLSTVSGGGYIGACLSSLLSSWRGPENQARDYVWSRGSLGRGCVDGEEMVLLRRDQEHHLRRYGDFLIARRGILKRDTLRVVGSAIAGVAWTSLLCAGALVLVTSFLLACAGLLAGDAFWSTDPAVTLRVPSGAATWPPAHRDALLAALVAGGAPMLMWAAVAWRRPLRPRVPDVGETVEDGAERRRVRAYGFFLFAFILGAIPAHAWLIGTARDPWRADADLLLVPGAYFAGAWAMSLIAHALFARPARRWTASFRSVFGAMQGLTAYGLIAAGGFVILMIVIRRLARHDIAGYGAATVGALLMVSRALIKLQEWIPARLRLVRAARSVALKGAIATLVLLAIAGAVVVCARLILPDGGAPPGPASFALWGLVGLATVLLVGSLVDFNRISPHHFYSDRLAEAYLRTESRSVGGLRVARDDSALRLAELHGRAAPLPPDEARGLWSTVRALHDEVEAERYGREGGPPEGQAARREADLAARLRDLVRAPANAAPYHLIECAQNLAGSRDLARRTRKSDVFVFSRLFCGSGTSGYVPTDIYRAGATSLKKAVTISGAAASSVMGSFTNGLQAFAMTLFNVRLGYWMANPNLYPEAIFGRREPEAMRRPTGRIPPGVEREHLVFWPWYLRKEMLATTGADDWLVHLSDGGHTGDNLGLYPLLQRRCRLILVCDSGCDPTCTFESIAAAIRMINTDENVQVRIALEPLRPAAGTGLSAAHYAIGRIWYPEDTEARKAGDPDAAAAEGWLVYIKSGLDGSEPAPVVSYRTINPVFPHQTTSDQFFDDDQFESYRALGDHVLGDVLAGMTADGRSDARAWIEWCERSWRAAGEPALRAREG